MEYEVQLLPIDKMVINAKGVFEPLCNSCSSPDCSNPIRERSVSIAGQIKKSRFYIVNEGIIRQVVSCKGYVGDVVLPVGDQPKI